MPKPSRTEAIKNLLNAWTHRDLANLYNYSMEVQVNVSGDGEGVVRITGDYKGRNWHGYQDASGQIWKPFRIPWNANKNPEYKDTPMSFDLAQHAEAIGMTGWDWENRVSRWVAFDFDSITNHKIGLTDNELNTIEQAVSNIDWVTVRKSTSGSGIHLYIYLEPVETNNHTEHSALARAILGQLNALTGHDFQSQVDACGGNMWVWHRKMTTENKGLTLIKQGTVLEAKEIPPNWKDHIKVVTGKRRRNLPQQVIDNKIENEFEEISNQHPHIDLDDVHKALIKWLKDNDKFWYWNDDNHVLVTHTAILAEAHDSLNLRGIFKTNSPASNIEEQNCFMHPIRNGAWVCRRFTPGVTEDPTWDQDGRGWTRCYYNKYPDIQTAARTYGGQELKKGGFRFQTAELMIKAAAELGINIDTPVALAGREAFMSMHKDKKRLVLEIKHEPNDIGLENWTVEGKNFTSIHNMRSDAVNQEDDLVFNDFDETVRHMITNQGENYGWAIKANGQWQLEPLTHISAALQSLGVKTNDVKSIIGACIIKSWKIVNIPFESEYPGNREWNRNAAQLRYIPSKDKENLKYDTWLKVLNHCGSGLDEAIQDDPWCKANSIITGGDYLKCWAASLFQKPLEPLPYLFFYGPQNSGKSIFHEALSLLFTQGAKRADAALISQSGFNAELEGCILAIIEEIDLNKNNTAYNRIKDWVTSREIMIHEKGRTPYHVINTTKWVQCANYNTACPIFQGDTRITMCFVKELDPIELIPKRILIEQLKAEASDFLAEIMNLEIPPSNDRLYIPVIDTADKHTAAESNKSDIQDFFDDICFYVEGAMIKYSDLHDRYCEWCVNNGIEPKKIRSFGKELPTQYVKGRLMSDTGQWYIGNISYMPKEDSGPELCKLTVKDNELVRVRSK